MKSNKLLALLCTTATLLSYTACDSKKNDEDKSSNNTTSASIETTEKKISESKTESSKEKETKATSTNSSENLSDIVIKDVEDTVAILNSEYEDLKTEIDTYAKYLSNTDKIEAFYAKIQDTNYSLCIKMYEYSLDYAESIVNSDISNDDKYDELEELYDSIYDDASDEIYDSIYDGILEDMYDDFYDGLLDDAYDNEEYSEYSEWSDARSDEYKWWSNTRSEVYENWSDMRSDIYKFQSDLRGELWSDDIDKALKKIDDFCEDIKKLNKDISQTGDTNVSNEEKDIPVTETEALEEDKPTENLVDVDGIRPEFKKALDSYEDFFDEYCDFMKKFNESPDDLTLLGEYTEYLTQYAETMDKMNELDNGEMNDAEMKYYIEVTTRINTKLLDVSL